MKRGDVMGEKQPRKSREDKKAMEISLPKQVWNKYRYLTVYAASISTLLLILQLRGH